MQDEREPKVISPGNVSGDYISGSISNADNAAIGKNIAIGRGTIKVSETQLQELPSKYAQSLEEFSKILNEHLIGQQVPEEQIIEVNKSLNDFAQEVKDIKPEEENNIKPGKRRVLNGQFGNIVRGVLKVLPTAARIASTLFAPLTPFSGLIGETVEKVVSDYTD